MVAVLAAVLPLPECAAKEIGPASRALRTILPTVTFAFSAVPQNPLRMTWPLRLLLRVIMEWVDVLHGGLARRSPRWTGFKGAKLR
jgi:hypothetical protein